MDIAKRGATLFVVLMAFAVFLASGCKAAEKDCVEYRDDRLAFYRDDNYTERYLLYEDGSKYERYIGGTYKGYYYPGPNWGTLYETGIYRETVGGYGKTRGITFRPKERYHIDKKTMWPMTASDIEKETREGTITEQTLRITYFDEDYISSSFFSSPWFVREYTRK